jgi:hypothetical protein
MQRIFSSATRHETLGKHLKVIAAAVSQKSIGQNRGPERGPCALIAGWISGEDLKEPEALRARDWRELGRPLVASADRICPLENVRDEPRGCTAPVAWPGQARPPQFDLHPKTVLFIMRYRQWAVCCVGSSAGSQSQACDLGDRLGTPTTTDR